MREAKAVTACREREGCFHDRSKPLSPQASNHGTYSIGNDKPSFAIAIATGLHRQSGSNQIGSGCNSMIARMANRFSTESLLIFLAPFLLGISVTTVAAETSRELAGHIGGVREVSFSSD